MPDGEHGYAFRHALLREAIYADLLPGERTRLHGRLAELLAEQRRVAEVPGTAAELAHHSLASHDIPGAFVASVAAGQEADRLAAPAEAHRHYDQALSLWERVEEPEKLSGMTRGKLAFRSANSAAASGDIVRAVQQMRRLLGFMDGSGGDPADPVLVLPGQRAAELFPARHRRGRGRDRGGRGGGRGAAGGAAAVGAGPGPGHLRPRAADDEGRRPGPVPGAAGPGRR